jgi:hypothetical protein
VGLGPTAVVRLERALAHSWAPGPQGGWTAAGRGRGADRPVPGGTQQQSSTRRTTVRSAVAAGQTGGRLEGHRRGTRHRTTAGAVPTRRHAGRRKILRHRLWTTACWPSRRVVSVTPVVGPFPCGPHRPSAGAVPDGCDGACRVRRSHQTGTSPGNRCTQAVDEHVDAYPDGVSAAPSRPRAAAVRATARTAASTSGPDRRARHERVTV